jgi:hypothetical protein
VKPIETEYAGYRFRSRLEARWAVFFDTASIEYRYEPEGFVLPWSLTPGWSRTKTFRYLPDFWLPGLQMWAEVKADWSAHDHLKFLNAVHAMDATFLVLGDIFQQPRGGSRRPWKLMCGARGKKALLVDPWPPVAGNRNYPDALSMDTPLLGGYRNENPAPDWYREAARAAQRARFEFGQTPGRPTL